MKYLSLKHILFSFILLISSKLYAGACNAGFYDLCWQSRCDEYITVDLENNVSYPYDSYWDSSTNRFVCPNSGCKLCGIDASGNMADDCFSPFPILSQIPNGKFALKTTTTLLYNMIGYPKSCGPKNYKDMPVMTDVANFFGIDPPKVDGYSERSNRNFYFDISNNPMGGSQYIYAPASQVGPGDFYLLQPRIEIIGTKKVIRFYISQWGWHLEEFLNFDGTLTKDYFPIYSGSFTNYGTIFGAQIQWLRWRRMVICDDYNDYYKSDGELSDYNYGADYNNSDHRYCYVKLPTWNKLYDVQVNGYYDCDKDKKSGLDIKSFIGTQSDSVRKIRNVCRLSVDNNNARDVLSSGIVIPPASGQYNFYNVMSEFQGGNYSVVTEPIFNLSAAPDSTYLTPKAKINISGGNPNAQNSSDEFDANLGGMNFEYQDGYFKYRLILNVESNNSPGSQPQLCLYGCQVNNDQNCIKTDNTLDSLILEETDKALLDYNKDFYLLDDCISHKNIATEDSVQDYKIDVTGLGLGSTYQDPRVKFTITNTKNTAETVTKTLYLRSIEDNTGNQTIPYDKIEEYNNENSIPAYQIKIDDSHDYINFDFKNTYYAFAGTIDDSIYTYLFNQQDYKIVLPFLFNNKVIYNEDYTIYDSKGNITNQPCSEFLWREDNCSYNSQSSSTECQANAGSNMCTQNTKYYEFLCINNLYNEFFTFYGSSSDKFSISKKDSMYSYNDNLINNDYYTYLNSAEYNNIDPQFPSNANNLCIPSYYPIDFDNNNFYYELNNTGINTADINLKITRTDETSRSFNNLDVPDPDTSSTFDYNNFDISTFTNAEKNSYCESSINSNVMDIRYDYYHKFLFKIYNHNGFIYVCYKQYDSPSSPDLPSDWSILTAYTMDFSTGNKIYTDFINLNICPDYSGNDIDDFLSCQGEGAAHYETNGVERWCSCSSATDWNDYSTSEQNAAWSQLDNGSVKVKAKCMMDGSWQMTDPNSYCPVYCNADESGEQGAEMPRTLAVEGEYSDSKSVICLNGKSLYGGTKTYQCSGMAGTEGQWLNSAGSGLCKSNCPDAYYDNNNNSASSSSYHYKLNSTGLLTSDQTYTFDCAYGYSGTATATCDYNQNEWINISNTCSASPLTCAGGWQTRGNFNWYYLTYMYVGSGGHDCQGSDDVAYNYYSYSFQVYLSTKTHGESVTVNCNDNSYVKINGSTGSKNYVSSGDNITASCVFSGSGNTAKAEWSIDSSSCKPNCYDLQDGYYHAPGSYDDYLRNHNERCSGGRRNRWCTGTCGNNGQWIINGRYNGSCR